MGVRIGDIASRFEILSVNDPSTDRIRHRFVGTDEALRFLRRHLYQDEVLAEARRWCRDQGLHHPTERGFLQVLAAALTAGTVWIGELERPVQTRRGGVGPGGGGNGIDPVPPRIRPGPKLKPVAELLVNVRNILGEPVEGVTVTADALGTKTTDANGVADYGRVAPGTYKVTAEKAGHGLRRNGPVIKDELNDVAVPDGSKKVVDLIQTPECANVAFFEGSTTRSAYFGFDHKTNIKPTGGHPYWDPVPAKGTLTMPTDKFTRDEARWVSVAKDQETQVEINFAFSDFECIPCLANTTYQVIPATVAEVVTARIGAKKAAFKIKGLAPGEATLKVICDGHEIGWFHIFCDGEKTILVDVACLLTTRSDVVAYDTAAITAYLNDVFRQALMKVSVKDLGLIDLSNDADLVPIEDKGYTDPSGSFLKNTSGAINDEVLGAMDDKAVAMVKARTGDMDRSGRPNAKRLYLHVPTPISGAWGGWAVGIGGAACFVFFNNGLESDQTCAHEVGHLLYLRHPSDNKSAPQYAPHNFASRGAAVPDYPGTNTERSSAVDPTWTDVTWANIMANDPTNLMGYWPVKSVSRYLRYHQWKTLRSD